MDDNPNWLRLMDAYGDPYDPRAAIAAIEHGDAEAGYNELWQRAHHQGDLGTAAYAVLPQLVRLMTQRPDPDWRAYALIATIDECPKVDGNPRVPEWLESSYDAAMNGVVLPALE